MIDLNNKSTVLDPHGGRGIYLIKTIEYARSNGIDLSSKNVYYNDINPAMVAFFRTVNKRYKYGIPDKNITCEDALKKEWNMRFSTLVGNPPYQRSDTKAKRWTLWEEFLAKSLTMADTVALVVPQSLTSPGASFDSIKENCRVLNTDVSRHFNVGSTFCSVVLDTQNKVTDTRIITPNGEFTHNISKFPFLPIDINVDTLAKVDDLLARPKRKWKRGELHTSNQNLFDPNGQYEVFHTNAQQLRSNHRHANLTKIRVAVSLSGYPQFRVIQNGLISQACFWCEFDTIAEAQHFADECNGSEIQELLSTFKWSGWNSREVIECL